MATAVLPACPFSTCVTPVNSRNSHPEGEPCVHVCVQQSLLSHSGNMLHYTYSYHIYTVVSWFHHRVVAIIRCFIHDHVESTRNIPPPRLPFPQNLTKSAHQPRKNPVKHRKKSTEKPSNGSVLCTYYTLLVITSVYASKILPQRLLRLRGFQLSDNIP